MDRVEHYSQPPPTGATSGTTKRHMDQFQAWIRTFSWYISEVKCSMASCGFLTRQTSACADCTQRSVCTPQGGRLSRIARRAIGLALLVVTVGCSTPPVSDGRPAPTNRLGSLETGVSTEAEVRTALGEPRGNGMVRHSSDQATLRTIWYYEYVQLKGDQIGLKILLVFFDNEIYDGHLWFAANELVNRGAL